MGFVKQLIANKKVCIANFHRKVGRQVFTGLTSEQVKTTLETMFNIYLKRRIENESFQSFTNRHDLDALQGMFSNDE